MPWLRLVMSKRKPLSPKRRFDILERDNFTCQSCGAKQSDDVLLEVDHIEPVSKGGTNDIDNLVTLCYKCNRGKGARILGEKQAVKLEESRVDEMHKKMQQKKDYIKYKEKLKKQENVMHLEVMKKMTKILGAYETKDGYFQYTVAEKGKEWLFNLQKKYGFEDLVDALYDCEHLALVTDTKEMTHDELTKVRVKKLPQFYQQVEKYLMKVQYRKKPTIGSRQRWLSGILKNRLNDYDSWEYTKDVAYAIRDIEKREDKIRFFDELAIPHAEDIAKGSSYDSWYEEYMGLSNNFLKKHENN